MSVPNERAATSGEGRTIKVRNLTEIDDECARRAVFDEAGKQACLVGVELSDVLGFPMVWMIRPIDVVAELKELGDGPASWRLRSCSAAFARDTPAEAGGLSIDPETGRLSLGASPEDDYIAFRVEIDVPRLRDMMLVLSSWDRVALDCGPKTRLLRVLALLAPWITIIGASGDRRVLRRLAENEDFTLDGRLRARCESLPRDPQGEIGPEE